MKRSGLLLLLALGTSSTAYGQAWTRDAGHFYLNASVTSLSGGRLFSAEFDRQDLPFKYSQTVVGLYGEIGLVDRWLTFTFSSELYRVNQLEDQGRTAGLGDTRLGLFSGILTAPFRLTVGLVVGVPTGDNEPGAGDGADGDAVQIARSLPTGDGEWDVEPQIIAGYSFGGDVWPLKHYMTGTLGYSVRTASTINNIRTSFADAITYKFEVGTQIPYTFIDRFWFIARFYGTESFASNQEAAAGAAGLGNGVTFTSIGLEVAARIYEGLGASFKVDTAFRARSIIAAVPFQFALSYQY